MTTPNLRLLIISAAIGLLSISIPVTSHATSTKQINSQSWEIQKHFAPRPSKSTSIDFETLDFIFSETILYMGPSTRKRPPSAKQQLGTRLTTTHTSPYRLEGNKVMYSVFTKEVKSDMQSYAEELIELGNQLDIPSLSRNEQLAYWINLHNLVLITTISENYPPPYRRPTRINPIKGSSETLHDAKLITIDNVNLSLRDIREKIVFPNWKNKDVPYAFHLGYLGSPSMGNFAYSATTLKSQLKENAEEFVNSLRAYHRGELNTYFRDVAPWYYPDLNQDLDQYFKQRMRPEVYAIYKSGGIKKIAKEELTLADMTGGLGRKSSISPFQSDSDAFGIGLNITQFLTERQHKIDQLQKTEWFKTGTVTIEDIETTDGAPVVE